MLINRGEKVPEKDRRAENPFLVNDTVLYPSLGEPISKTSKEIGFYFVVYPGSGGPAPESVLQLLQNGSRIAEVPMALAAPDRSGRVQQVGRLPIDRLAPGTYELQAAVKQGGRQISRSTIVRITE